MPNQRGRGQRGRGRGRGRGARGPYGRGRGYHRGPRPQQQQEDTWEVAPTTTDTVYDIDNPADVTGIFSEKCSYDQHFTAQEKNKYRYLAALDVLDQNGVDIAQSAKARSLAAAWARRDDKTVDKLLKLTSLYGLPEVLKAVLILDAGRRCRQMEGKMKKMQLSGQKVSKKKLGKLKSEIDNLNAIKITGGSLTRRVSRHVAHWVKSQTAENLEYFALHLPKEPWMKLADLCHLHPSRDFPSCAWFLPHCFGTTAPEGTMVQICEALNADNVNDIVKEHEIPFSHLKKLHQSLSGESKAKIATYTSLDQVLWYYEELGCPLADEVVTRRLDRGDEVNLPLGKLLERLLTLKLLREGIGSCNVEYEWIEASETLRRKPRNNKAVEDPVYRKVAALAQKRLKEVSVNIEGPVAVLGDMSGSMDIAIRVSTLLACIISSITSASLIFFNSSATAADIDPNDVLQVVELAVSIIADKATCPAAAIKPFYDRKEVVKTFIVATDEEENQSIDNYKFLPLYKKYYEEVYPAKVVFVSFLRDQHAPGQMASEMRAAGFQPLQFKFSTAKPDLTKFDKLLGLLSTDSGCFDNQLAEATAAIRLELGFSLDEPVCKTTDKKDADKPTVNDNVPTDEPTDEKTDKEN